MEWFENTFLVSLFEKAGTNNYMWLSEKQTMVCLRNMKQYSSYGYKCEWQDRTVTFDYNKKNGCGVISFSLNPEEAEKAETEWNARQNEREYQFALRMAKRPERLNKEIENVSQAYADVLDDINAGLTYAVNYEATEQLKTRLNNLLRARKVIENGN